MQVSNGDQLHWCLVLLANLIVCNSQTLTSNSSCGAISYTNSSNMSGVITSHVNFSSAYYSPNMTCLRTLPKRSGYILSLTVTSLSLGSGDCLKLTTSSLDLSSFRSFPSNSMYCSSYSFSSAITIDSEDGAQIMFSSNGQNESSGFSISFAYAALIEGNFSVSNDSGEITSHSGVGITPYSNNMRYSWQITAPPGRVVWIKFAYISLQYPNDVVAVYDNAYGLPYLLVEVTNYFLTTNLPKILASSSNSMVVRFNTDSSGSGLGFRLQFNATTTFDYCKGTQYLSTNGGGEIMSHSGAGVSSYQNNMRCYWQITAPTGSIIAAIITYADFETCCDYVSLYDGSIGSTRLITQVSVSASSGYVSPRFTSSSNTMTVYFYSDNAWVNLGFKLSYNILNSYCSGFRNVSATDGGEIISHNEVRLSNYLNNMTCTWLISAPTGYKVTVWFTYLDLEDCCDTVTLYEGDVFASGTVSIYITNQTIAAISGISAPTQNYATTSNSMTVRFTTDGKTTRTGFVLRYSVQPVSLVGAIIGGTVAALVVLCIIFTLVVIKLRCPLCMTVCNTCCRIAAANVETSEPQNCYYNGDCDCDSGLDCDCD